MSFEHTPSILRYVEVKKRKKRGGGRGGVGGVLQRIMSTEEDMEDRGE